MLKTGRRAGHGARPADRWLTPLADGNGQNVDDLTELLESRAKQSSEKTYFEIDVFGEFGPWKADSYHYSNT